MKQAPWILCCVLFAIILYLQMCKSKPVAIPQSDYEAMKRATDDTVKYYEQLLKADSAAIELATAHAEESADRARASEDKVTESQGVIARLNAKIDASKKEKQDGTFIPVSPHYIEGCDSLKLASEYQDILINKHKKDNAALAKAKDEEIALRDNKLIDKENLYLSIKKQLENCQVKVKEKDSVKVGNQWFGEVGLLGNQVNPIGGGEAGITLINKRGVMYGIKGQIVGGRVWYGIKTGVRLFR